METPEFKPPEAGMGRFYIAVMVLVAVMACSGACIIAQLLEKKAHP